MSLRSCIQVFLILRADQVHSLINTSLFVPDTIEHLREVILTGVDYKIDATFEKAVSDRNGGHF